MFFSVTNSTASLYFAFFVLFFCMSTSFNDSGTRKDIQRLKLFTLLYLYRSRNKITQLSILTHAQLQRHRLKFII